MLDPDEPSESARSSLSEPQSKGGNPVPAWAPRMGDPNNMEIKRKHLCRLWSTLVLMAGLCAPAFAQVSIVFQENFDQLTLQPPVDEDSTITQAFTHELPNTQWQIDNSGVPGLNSPSIGIFEWKGWSFANKDFWIDVSDDERRSEFTRAQGVVAVADPDEWNDKANPANNFGFYNTFLGTPFFPINPLQQLGSRLKFQFDSSWRPQCCDDGEQFNPNENNKTATIRAIYEDGSKKELLRWESAPFFFTDALGIKHPSRDPEDTPNPDFKRTATDELVFVDLSELLLNPNNHPGFRLEFGLGDAGDDWWWAMDNMQMISLTTVPGDMDLNGSLDEFDIDDFAQAMHSTKDYIATHFGEFPATRGSLDSVFDFDDIDWFVDLLNGDGVAASRDTILSAIEAQAIPEPSTGSMVTLLLGLAFSRHTGRL